MEERVAIVVPAHNEERVLERSVITLDDYLQSHGLNNYDIIITNNNSTDNTEDIAKRLRDNKHIFYHFVEEQGKGIAIKDTWLQPKYDNYDVYCFMDADLSTGIESLVSLVEGIKQGYGLVIGSRYMPKSNRKRSHKRELISLGYRALFHNLFTREILDPQCGFKAVSKDVRNNILPTVENNGFFFDTELIMRTKKAGYKLLEMPVTWEEGCSSTVKFYRDIPRFLKGMVSLYLKLRRY